MNRQIAVMIGALVAVVLLAGGVYYAYTYVSAPNQASLQLMDPWARAAAPSAGSSAIYMDIKNLGKEGDRLLGVSTDAAEIVELHNSETRNGMSMMFQVQQIDIKGMSSVSLKPGGLHVMLIKLKRELKAGDKLPFTMKFEKTGEIQMEAEVRDQ
jgi:copper(I)-binding protein